MGGKIWALPRFSIGTAGVRTLSSLAMFLTPIVAWAQEVPISQEVTLQPGWNAVFLEVVPENPRPELVFFSDPFSENSHVDRAAMWTGEPGNGQFITDPAKLISGTPGWLEYRAEFMAEHNTLRRLLPGRAYLIHLSGSNSVTWHIEGVSGPRPIRWLPDNYTLTGFLTSLDAAPTFAEFFAGSAAHRGQRILHLINGEWAEIQEHANFTIERGKAYWVFTRGTSDFQGPLRVRLDGGGVLDFGATSSSITLALQADTANETPPRDLTVDLTMDAESDQTVTVPLSYRSSDYLTGTFSWESLSTTKSLALPALSERIITLQADRSGLPQGEPQGTRYASVLRIEGGGMRYDLPVYIGQGGDPRVGLWVGYAVLNRVSEHITVTEKNTDGDGEDVTLVKPRSDPTPVARPFSFRLLVHVDESGAARLLQKALLAYPEPANPIVLSSNEKIKAYTALLNDTDEQDGVRLSSPVFSFDEPVPGQSGSDNFPAGGTTGSLEFFFDLEYDDPINPFVHLYHPDHDNLDIDGNPIPPGSNNAESWTVTRTITLTFSGEDPEGRNPAGWGQNEVGGTYKEMVAGLMRAERNVAPSAGEPSISESNDIVTTGFFRLTRVTTTGVLDP